MLASGLGTGSSNYPDTLLPGAFMTAGRELRDDRAALRPGWGGLGRAAIVTIVVDIARPLVA